MPETPHLVLYDAYNSLYRSFHAIQFDMRSASGESVAAVYGFTRSILKTLRELSPTHFVVCWDSKPKERLALYPEYKANRAETPEVLKTQILLAREFLNAWGLPSLEIEGCEADDLMADLALQAEKKGWLVTLITTDKDMLQLATPQIRIFLEHKKEMMDAEAVRKRFGFGPELLADYFSLLGDAVDNVPGVPGVGEKTAQKLVAQFGSVENILEAAKTGKDGLTPKLRQTLLASQELLALNKKLLSMSKTSACLEEGSMSLKPPAPETKDFLLKLGFASLLKEFDGNGSGAKEAETGRQEPAPPLILDWRAIEDSSKTKVFHDLKAQMKLQPELAARIRGPVLDTKLLAWVANPSEESFELDWIMARQQASSMEEAAQKLADKVKRDNLWKLYEEMELPLTFVLFEMEREGIRADAEFLKSLREEWNKELSAIHLQIIKLSGAEPDLNINSTKQLAFLLFEKLGLPKIRKTKTGYSTDEDVLQKLKPMHEVVAKILEHRELSKLLSTYVEGLLSCIRPDTGRIHATFQQQGTQTGRFSCVNPNLQNIPVKNGRGLLIRKAFVPREPGWRFLTLDYSQIDLRVFAHLSEDPKLIQFFREERDIHTETAKALLGAGDGEVPADLRRAAKAVNFGILYGMGARGLAEAIGKTFEQAQEIIDLYYARFPQVAQWRQGQIEEARRTGCVRTLSGRLRYLENILSPRVHLREFSERAAVNTPVQGTSADIIKLAMIRLSDFIKAQNLRTRMLVQVHDDILFEGPEKELRERAPEFMKIMENAMPLKVPLIVNAKIGPNWRDLEVLK